MTKFILMDAAQAQHARYGTIGDDQNALRPIALADGVRFVLPLAILSMPEFASLHDLLSTFPQEDVADSAFPQPVVS